MEIIRRFKKLIPNSWKYTVVLWRNAGYSKGMLEYDKMRRPYQAGKYPQGINLIGNIRSASGLGQSMRILAKLLHVNHIPFTIIQIELPGFDQGDEHSWDEYIGCEAIYNMNIIHVNPDIWARIYQELPMQLLDERYNVAYWLWELEELPKRWRACLETVEEVWAPSEFICNSIKRCTEKPVIRVPYSIDMSGAIKYGREHFQLPKDCFLFLMMFDAKSVCERKNPWGVIKAFKRAFPSMEANEKKIGLILKVGHIENKALIEKYQRALADYQYVYFLTDTLNREEVEALIAEADVLVSLHRSEGFGLPIAEAMYMGTPVITTNWSATTEFTNKTDACLVNYRLITLKKRYGPYEKGNRWADADITQAAGYMRRLREDKGYYEEHKEQAKRHIREIFDERDIGGIIMARIQDNRG